MKRAILAAAAFSVAAMIFPWNAPHGSVAVAATPAPAALAYDEINRMMIPPATPPAPGSFQTDYQAIVTNGGATPQPHRGLGAVVNSVMGNPEGMMDRMRLGNLVRYTYYKGWIRTDQPVEQTAVIEKCQEHQYIHLDLAKKTYTIENVQPPCPSTMMPGGMTRPEGSYGQQAQPGTADMNFSGTSQDLGPLTIDGIATSGWDNSMQMSTTNATGSCRNGDFKMSMMKYVSQIRVPRPYCPLPKTMTTGGMMSRGGSGGCEPRMHMSGSLQGMSDMDRLIMYMRMGLGGGDANTGAPSGMAMVVERGNVKSFSGAEADALFTVPPGFTQAQ